jgi:hypothetical protein
VTETELKIGDAVVETVNADVLVDGESVQIDSRRRLGGLAT